LEFLGSSGRIIVCGDDHIVVAVMELGEVGRLAVYGRYSKGPRTLPWGIPASTGVRSVSSMLTFTMKWRLDK
jgi:hypothetical protein